MRYILADEVEQPLRDDYVPTLCASGVRLFTRCEPLVREAKPRRCVFGSEAKNHPGASPFGLILLKPIQPAFCDQPDNPFVRNDFDQFLL
jgi:hypothetical protein